MEASALRHSGRLALLSKRSTLLRLQGDERLIELTREGHDRAFEALVDRYQSRLQAFCRGMLRSNEDAEDILQEVFVAAHGAMLADSRPINARPWLYRIARNRCLNHLRKPVAEGQDSMDLLPGENGVSVAERVQKREDFRALISDVGDLAETQRTALLLREIDDLSYDEIAQAMDTTIPAVKSLLVRARMSLADATHGRKLTCDEVRLTLAEAAEGLTKASGAERSHIKSCEPCRQYRDQLRSNNRALAALAPIGALAALKHFITAKLGVGGANAGAGASAGGTATAGGAGTVGASAAAAGGSGGAFSVAGGAAGIIGTKAVAGMASVALLTAGAVEAKHYYGDPGGSHAPAIAQVIAKPSLEASSAPPAVATQPQVHRGAGVQAEDTAAPVAKADTADQPVAPAQPQHKSAPVQPPTPAEPETTDETTAPDEETQIQTGVSGEPVPGGVAGPAGPGGTGGDSEPPTEWPGSPTPTPTPGNPTDPPAPPTTTPPSPVDPTPVPGGGSATPDPAPDPAQQAAPVDPAQP